MKQLVDRFNRYFRYYQAAIRYSLKGILAYRLDLVLRVVFILVYLFTSIGFINIVFSKTNNILGWTWGEVFFFMATVQVVWTLGYVLYFQNLRDFSWSLVRYGDLDFLLLRPINIQFQLSFSKISFTDVPSFILSCFLFVYGLDVLNINPHFWNIIFFIVGLILAEIIYYLTAFIIATFSLYSSSTGDAFEFFDRAMEFSKYPTDVLEGKFYFMFYTIIPLALLSFLPCRFLLGKAPFWMIIIPIVVSVALYFISRLLFQQGLRHYSSASS